MLLGYTHLFDTISTYIARANNSDFFSSFERKVLSIRKQIKVYKINPAIKNAI